MKKFLKILIASLLLLVGVLVALYFGMSYFSEDVELDDYSDLIPEKISVDGEKNGVELLKEFGRIYKTSEGFNERELVHFLRGEEFFFGSDELIELLHVEDYLSKNEEALELINEMSDKDYFLSEGYLASDSLNTFSGVEILGSLNYPFSKVFNLLNIKALYDFKVNEDSDSAALAVVLIDFIEKFSISTDSLLAAVISFDAFESSLNSLYFILGSPLPKLDEPYKKLLSEKINSLEIDTENMCDQGMKFEMMYFIGSVDGVVDGDYSGYFVEKYWDEILINSSYYFKPNLTKNGYFELMKMTFDKGELEFSDGIYYDERWSLLLYENSFGGVLMQMIYPNIGCWANAEQLEQKLKELKILAAEYEEILEEEFLER